MPCSARRRGEAALPACAEPGSCAWSARNRPSRPSGTSGRGFLGLSLSLLQSEHPRCTAFLQTQRPLPTPKRHHDREGARGAPKGLLAECVYGGVGRGGAPRRPGPQQSPLRLISDPLAISTDTNENCLAPGAVPSKSRLEPPPQRPPDPCSAPSPGPSCRRLPPLAFLLLLTPHLVAQFRPRSTSFSARRHLQITLGTSPRPAAPCRPLRTPGRLTRRRRGGGDPFPAAAPAAREPAEPTVGRGPRRAARPLRLPLPMLRRQPRRISRRAFI